MRTLDQSEVLSSDDVRLLHELKTTIHRFLPKAEILLYGSVARGTDGPASDYDILVLTDEPLTSAQEEAIDDAVYDIQLQNGVLIVTSFRTRDAWSAAGTSPFRKHVERDATLL